MPGDRKHHTDKFRSCVEQVIASGKSEDSAYAICTTSLQDAGEPIFEAAEMQQLHLLGATGIARTEIEDGKEYLVVPVVALMEGVIHAVNADTPEFVSFETLERAAATWNGRPVTLGHPMRGGKQCSANHPEVLAAHGIGMIRNSHVDAASKKMLQEAWIEKAKAKKLHPEMYDRLLQNKTEEVSVGAFVVTDKLPGDHNGKAYKASWLETTGDHLAFLPGGRGACSVAMGCGTHRAAMRVCEDHLELEVLRKKEYKECPMCKGTGNTGTNPCDACDGTGELRAAAISPQPAGKKDITPAAVRPQPRAAGCGCQHTNASECGCNGEHHMTRAEIIASLVSDKHSGFKAGDDAMLETCSDVRLEEFRAAAEATRAAERDHGKTTTELTKANARLSVAEERLRTAEQNPTEDEWLAKAPPKIKVLLDAHKAQEDAVRASLVAQLKVMGANTEDELKAMDLDKLKQLAAYARVDVPDFSGRGLPVERNASEKTNYAPPDPYAAALAAQRGSKAVN